jgi:hypothetical protein
MELVTGHLFHQERLTSLAVGATGLGRKDVRNQGLLLNNKREAVTSFHVGATGPVPT